LGFRKFVTVLIISNSYAVCGVCRVLFGKYEGKRTLGRPRRRWGIILRLIFRKGDGEHGLD